MKKNLLCLIFILTSIITYAQEDRPAAYEVYEGYNYWGNNKGDTAYVFADVAYVRDYPSTSSVLLDSLTHGTMVTIISDGYNESIIRGFAAPWHEISYLKNGQIRKGFIWLGLLALGRHVDGQGNQFIHGFLRFEPPTSYGGGNEYLCEVKYLTPQQELIARQYYPVTRDGQNYSDSKLLPNMGLEGLQSIHRVGFHGEACGIPTTHYYLGWNGQNFVTMFSKTSVGDAGVYYYEEKILFPSEHHLDPTLIIKDIVEGEVIDYDAEELEYKETKRREKYTWDGKSVWQVLEMR
ncbi:SH3 domain-containing protein [Sphingobacterium wenxiniae]|uniref:SH3 domain-containing protein n=1 Tax=Sphingobacterium wenxiniae TaxID=683125 RepID=A0A1I6T0P6_9SPHI|nr:hypothetical protein [Sphingobacterium wenxiniae]SFS82824.1 hypothetical protein SAMN05660206_105192 [Sphingobacterium wenxiniae]